MAVETAAIVDSVQAITWTGKSLRLLDQRHLPAGEKYVELYTAVSVAEAIRNMVVRGAPAIGVTAAYGVVLAAKKAYQTDKSRWRELVESDLAILAGARPTAVNLAWALARMRDRFRFVEEDPVAVLLNEAAMIHREDIDANHRMGELGAAIIADCRHVLTHCNTGSLATGGYGTALGVIRSAFAAGTLESVFVNETRPWLQGSRLTAWECRQDQIPVTVIADSAAGALMQQGKVDAVVVGADRIAVNGDVANKIGTYSLAVAARHHGLKFIVVVPCSTIDRDTAGGEDIPIEDRGASEITEISGQIIAPAGVAAWNPVFDITPATLVDVLVTEKGVIERPDNGKIETLFSQ